jgi:hypothetical protein
VILALDPSSTCIGWAKADNGRIVEAGRIRPEKGKAEPLDRILSMLADLMLVLLACRDFPRIVVVEIPSGHVGARHHGGGAGLATYGMAVGAVYAYLQSYRCRTVPVKENVWTRGRPKAQRQRELLLTWPEYRKLRDPGGDIADAAGLALWYMEHKLEV